MKVELTNLLGMERKVTQDYCCLTGKLQNSEVYLERLYVYDNQ